MDGGERSRVRKVGDTGECRGQIVQVTPQRLAGVARCRHVGIAEPQRLRIAGSGPVGKPIEAVALADDALGKFAGQNSIRLVHGGNGTGMLSAKLRISASIAAMRRCSGDTPFVVSDVPLGRPGIEGGNLRCQKVDGRFKLFEALALGGQGTDGEVANAFRDLVAKDRRVRPRSWT